MKKSKIIISIVLLIAAFAIVSTILFVTNANNEKNSSSKKDENFITNFQNEVDEEKISNENTKQNVNLDENNIISNTSNELKKVEQKDYTTITYGKYDSFDENEMPIGSKITAYPLDITEVLSKSSVAIEYGELYKYEWIIVSGYVHYQKNGFFVISPSNNENVEKYVGTVVAEDKNIRADYNWNIKDGDYITIAGLCKGTYRPGNQQYYVVMNDVFIVE